MEQKKNYSYNKEVTLRERERETRKSNNINKTLGIQTLILLNLWIERKSHIVLSVKD